MPKLTTLHQTPVSQLNESRRSMTIAVSIIKHMICLMREVIGADTMPAGNPEQIIPYYRMLYQRVNQPVGKIPHKLNS
jgi:hypothetical protein